MSLRRHAFAQGPLARALLVSLLGHAVLLVGVNMPLPLAVPAPAGEGRVQASLRALSGAPQAEALGKSLRAAPAPLPVERERRPVRNETRLLAAQEVVPEAPQVPAASIPQHAPERPAGVEAAPTAAAAAPATREGAEAGTGRRRGAQGTGGGDGAVPGEVRQDDVRHYRVALAAAAKRFKRYPPLARERGWEGTVEVAVLVHAALPRPDVKLMRSSGREMLDAQALDMVIQAVRVAEMPSGLRGRDLRIDLPVLFSLEDER